jgi:hypothetical protein
MKIKGYANGFKPVDLSMEGPAELKTDSYNQLPLSYCWGVPAPSETICSY